MSKDERNHPASKYGTDKQFLRWVSFQPSIIDQTFNQHADADGHPRNIACHVRRIKLGAGMGIKPAFSAVPMTDDQHKLQSASDGEARVLRRYTRIELSQEQAAIWFERAADRILAKWIEHQKVKGK